MEPNTQVEKFDPSTLMQGVKDRIKAQFVSLIPDDQWEIMIQKEVNAFFNLEQNITLSKQKEYAGYSASNVYQVMEVQQTPFRALVWEYCTEMTVKLLKEKINKEYFENTWSVDKFNADEKIQNIIAEAAPMAMANFFKAISFGLMKDMKVMVQNNQGY